MQGTPQGGILSPLVWNLMFDDLLDRFNFGPAHIKGFADDADIVLRGPDIHTLIEQGQEAISKALDFGHENGLEFGADKIEVVVFTCKRIKTSGLPCLHMANKDLTYSDTVKYLGVLLDNKLIFDPHIREKMKKATRLLYHLKNSVGQPISYEMGSNKHSPAQNHVWGYSLGKL